MSKLERFFASSFVAFVFVLGLNRYSYFFERLFTTCYGSNSARYTGFSNIEMLQTCGPSVYVLVVFGIAFGSVHFMTGLLKKKAKTSKKKK